MYTIILVVSNISLSITWSTTYIWAFPITWSSYCPKFIPYIMADNIIWWTGWDLIWLWRGICRMNLNMVKYHIWRYSPYSIIKILNKHTWAWQWGTTRIILCFHLWPLYSLRSSSCHMHMWIINVVFLHSAAKARGGCSWDSEQINPPLQEGITILCHYAARLWAVWSLMGGNVG